MNRAGVLLRRVAYAVADAVTLRRGLVRRIDGEALRLPPAWARYYPAVYEPAKRAFLVEECVPGSTVLDLGAHIGLYTVVMARAVGAGGAVISFEPTPMTRRALARTVAINGLTDRVEVRAEAVADAVGTLSFHDTGADLSNANSLVAREEATSSYEVPTTTVDHLLADRGGPRVTCLKIDVEGAELAALRGAVDTIERWRPALALEVHPVELGPDGMASLWELLAGAGYEVAAGDEALGRVAFLARTKGFEVQCRCRRV